MKRNYTNVMRFLLSTLVVFNSIFFILFITAFTQSVSPIMNYPDKDIYKKKFFEYNHTKMYLTRMLHTAWQGVFPSVSPATVKETLSNGHIPLLEIEIDAKELQKLHENLPVSSKNYVPVRVKENIQWEDAELKYRGDSHYHWAFEKKSLLIRKKDGRRLHLVNPKSDSFIAFKLASDLARDVFHLISPTYTWRGVLINGTFYGIYEDIEDIGDEFAKKHGFSAIFSGEKLLFTDTNGPGLFQDPKRWETVGGYAGSSIITDFLSGVENTRLDMFDMEYVVNFYAWVSFIQNHYYDDKHNWMIGYKDGKYYPIVADPWAWMSAYELEHQGIEETFSPVSRMLRENDTFNSRFRQKLASIVNNSSTREYVHEAIEKEKKLLREPIRYDVLKGGIGLDPDDPTKTYQSYRGMRFPQGTDDVLSAMDSLNSTIDQQMTHIRSELSESSGGVMNETGSVNASEKPIPSDAFDISFSRVGVSSFFNFNNEVKEEGTVFLNGQKSAALFEKKKFSDEISVSLQSPVFGNKEFRLKLENNGKKEGGGQIAVWANGFQIDDYTAAPASSRAGGVNVLRIEKEDKLTVPLEKAEEVWEFLRENYGENDWNLEYFQDVYYDTSAFPLLSGAGSVRHRKRVNLTNPADPKSGRDLVQIKVNEISSDPLIRAEYKFNVRYPTEPQTAEDKHPLLGIVDPSQREDFKKRLREIGIVAEELKPVLSLDDTRRRIYIYQGDEPFFSISLDHTTSSWLWAKTEFVEIEPELDEVTYTEADQKKRQLMEQSLSRMIADIHAKFPFVVQDLDPKYVKAFHSLEKQRPFLKTFVRLL